MKLLVITSVLLIASRADAGEGLPSRQFGVGFDGAEVDLGPGGASCYGVALLLAVGGGRFQLVGDAAFGDLEANGASGDLGWYARSSLGIRMFAATVSGERHGIFGHALEAGIGHASYFLEPTTVHRPTTHAGWTLLMGGAEDGHGLLMTMQVRLEASSRLDDMTALRAICRGPCPVDDAAAIDLTMGMVIGVSGW